MVYVQDGAGLLHCGDVAFLRNVPEQANIYMICVLVIIPRPLCGMVVMENMQEKNTGTYRKQIEMLS